MNPKKWGILVLLLTADAALAGVLAKVVGITTRPFLGWLILNFVIAGALLLAKYASSARSSRARRRRQYAVTCVTLRGEKVKSNGEKLIADYLFQNKIRYMYEKPARTKNPVPRNISRPDFYLQDYDVYIEYWGMVNTKDEKTRSEYVRSMNWKMAQYYNNDIKFISIYPNNLDNLDLILRRELRGRL